MFELEFPSRTTRLGAGVRAEDIEPNVTLVRIELAGRPPMVVRAFGHDQPARWAAYVSSLLPRGTRVTSVVALDAAGRAVAESEHDQYLSHPACTIFR